MRRAAVRARAARRGAGPQVSRRGERQSREAAVPPRRRFLGRQRHSCVRPVRPSLAAARFANAGVPADLAGTPRAGLMQQVPDRLASASPSAATDKQCPTVTQENVSSPDPYRGTPAFRSRYAASFLLPLGGREPKAQRRQSESPAARYLPTPNSRSAHSGQNVTAAPLTQRATSRAASAPRSTGAVRRWAGSSRCVRSGPGRTSGRGVRRRVGSGAAC